MNSFVEKFIDTEIIAVELGVYSTDKDIRLFKNLPLIHNTEKRRLVTKSKSQIEEDDEA